MELSDYVFHSVNELNDGCCVLVGNYLITAGHIVECQALIVKINDQIYELSKDKATIYKWDKEHIDSSANDVAVFRIDDYSSPIEFDTCTPTTGMILTSVSYEHKVEAVESPNSLFPFCTSRESFETHKCKAVISQIAGNFFQCKTELVLRPGSSGSPVFRDDKFMGILHGGIPGEHKCVFMSAESILKLIKGT